MMQDYLEDLIYGPEEVEPFYAGEAIEMDLDEEDDIDEWGSL